MNPSRPQALGTVMIVDDAPGNLAFLSDALEEAGYRVLVATDGASALEQLRYAQPDAILLDAVMPGLDGFETCRRLKADPGTSLIPVIFMTALSELDDLLRAFEEGAVDYLVKPIRHQEVLARVGSHMAQARLVRRSEDALVRSGFAALAIDGAGGITWLTPAGCRWLQELSGRPGGTPPANLPPPLAEWSRQRIAVEDADPQGTFTAQRDGKRFTARLVPCQDGQEYLLLLQESSGDWNLDSLKSALGLTPREAEILMWIARGKTNKDVGQILGSSPRTINKHLEHIFEKLGVATRAAAVAVALDRMRDAPEAAA
ncbi:response regulator transcription factor [Methylomagnum ishizawai]|uniref:response regulator transcription factor n=1 Tax=Methylomagnum ishizawai TaxID=1760988 RepID=UPI001C334EB0|nr:response regulator transcription factor [Methylomagnum ishizawai]BBL75150.1 DNA-binding response regulator [Methylomagnum ishizawai]